MSVITSNPWSMVLAIFVINVFMLHFNNAYNINVKRLSLYAYAVSFLEVLVYVVGLGMVMSSLDQIQNIFAYAFGFRLGF